MKRFGNICLVILVALLVYSAFDTIITTPAAASIPAPLPAQPYLAQSLPGAEPQVFAYGILNGELHSAPVFTPDLNAVYWCAADENGAFTNTCMDGQYFYDVDHPLTTSDGVTSSISNKLTTTLAATNLAAAQASYGAARTAIMGFTDSEGMPLRLIPDTLEVPPALEAVARIICEADKLQDNSPNPYKGTAKVLVNPGLTSATAWFLHVTNKQSIKPFIIQMRKAPPFVNQGDVDEERVFMRRMFRFGGEARATGVYGFWQLSVGSTG